MKDKLLILDMDNTILQSKIDFSQMQEDVRAILADNGLGRYSHRSVATSILNFSQSPDYDEKLAQKIWDRITELEAIGLDQAQLEPDALDALAYLNDFTELAVLSNNTDVAIGDNLERLGIAPYLSFVAGRNSVPYVKPSPEGMLLVKAHYPHIPLSGTLAVGDALIDAQAAEAADIGFVAYNRSRFEDWQKWHIRPLLQLNRWDRENCDKIRRLWK